MTYVLINNLFFRDSVQLIMEEVVGTIRWQHDTELFFPLKAYGSVYTHTRTVLIISA